MGFTKSKPDPNLYLKVVEDELVILLLYVDDLSLTGNERQIIGSLMYLTNTRLDICFAVNTLIQYLVQPRRVHLVTANM